MNNFKWINDCGTYTFKIHMAGDYNNARQLCQKSYTIEGKDKTYYFESTIYKKE